MENATGTVSLDAEQVLLTSEREVDSAIDTVVTFAFGNAEARQVFLGLCRGGFGKLTAGEVEGKRVCDCAVGVAASRVDDYIGRLIDDDDVVVFVEDIKRNFFGLDFFFGQFRQRKFDFVTGT